MKRLLPLVLVFSAFGALAQESDVKQESDAQVTFIYPLGTHGQESMDYENKFSFNLLFGLNGGVDGAEIGALVNYNDGRMKGFQLSGVGNMNWGPVDGVALSGVANLVNGTSKGALISGVGNYVNDEASGFHLSTINIARSSFTGFQGGVVNYASTANGVQLGVINYQGDNTAIPIGLVSIAKGGLFKFEAYGSEVFFANLNYKMGVERLYTVYHVGLSSYLDNSVYSFGIGFGSYLIQSERHQLMLDLTGNQVVYDNEWDSEINILGKLDLNYEFAITPKFSIMVGPSVNYYVTEVLVEGEYGTLDIPYELTVSEFDDGVGIFWIGGNLGLGLKL
ncbi:hypothetical protein HZ996_11875 [Cryomorphaceae bacterium]|nr:hypothetical protein HZ996_11875 [Cryomorphaceae bacterium]